MSLSRKAKIWIVILGIPFILVVGSIIALKLYFTGDRLKALVVPRLEQETGRTISIDAIDLSLLPSLAVEIDKVAISNMKGEGFSDRPLLTLDKLVLKVRLAALVRGTLEIPSVVLERPKLLLEINRDGMKNYGLEKKPAVAQPDTVLAAPVAPVGPVAKSGGAGFLLSNLQVIDGEVDYIDWQGNSATRIEGLNHQMRIEIVPAANQIRAEGRTSIEKLSYGTTTASLISNLRAAFDHALLYEKEKDLVTFQRGDGTLQDIPLKVSGTVSAVTQVPELNIVVGSDRVDIADLLSLAPKEYMQKAAGVTGTGIAHMRIHITGSVTDTTTAEFAGVISATNASIQYPQLPKPITKINLQADFARTRTKQEFRLTKLAASLGDNPITATLTLVNFTDPSLTMVVQAVMNLAEVKDYYPLEAGTQMSGLMKANVNISGKVSNPSGMKAAGSMEFQSVTVSTAGRKNPVQNLNGAITFNNQILEAKKLSMNLGRSDLSLAFSMKNYLSMMAETKNAPKPVANLTLNSSHLYTADLSSDTPAPTSDRPAPSPAATPPQSTQRVEQGGRQPQRSGLPLPNVDMDISATIGTLTMEKFELYNVRSTMRVANSFLTIQNLSCNTFDGSVITKGTLNLQHPERPTYDLAMDINGVDARAMLSKFTSFGKRLTGKFTMNTSLRGSLDDTLGLVPQSLNGQGRVQVENGKVTGMKVNSAIAGLLKLPDLEEINFKDWANTFSVSDGRINIKDLKISALGADYTVNGSHGLDGSMDYRMSVLLSDKASAGVSVPGFAAEAVKFFKDETGRVKLDLTVGGTTDDPKVSLDTRAAQQRVEEAAKRKVADESKKVQEQLKQKGQELLKDLFKKKK